MAKNIKIVPSLGIIELSGSNTNTSISVTDAGQVRLGESSNTGSLDITGDLVVAGAVTAREFKTEFVSASIIYQSGSTQFGDTADDLHDFTGTIYVTGSSGNRSTKITDDGFYISRNTVSNSYTTKLVANSNDSNNVDLSVRGAIFFKHNGDLVTSMTLRDTGNVGIGTTTPSHKLQVAGDIAVGQNDGFYVNNTNVGIERNANDLILGGFGGIIFKSSATNVSNQTERMRITSDGNVGINSTSTSGYRLYVNGSTWINGGTNYVDGQSIFRTNSGASEIMRLANNSNVGIGTTSPGSKLTVAGRVDFQNDLRLRGTDSAANQGVTRFFVDNSNKLHIDTANDGNNLFVIDSAGNVGIGTTSPAYKLELNGSTAAERTIGVDGDPVVYYPDQASSAYAYSIALGDGLRNATNTGGNTGTRNTAIGINNQTSVTTGDGNVSVGSQTLQHNTAGSNNIAMGHLAGQSIRQSNNAALGFGTLRFVATGSNNIALGHYAGYADGSNNTITQVNNSLYLGSLTKASSVTGNSNEIVIGYNAQGIGSNTVVLGNDSITTTALKGNVGIGTTSPSTKLQLKGNSTYITVNNNSNHNSVQIGSDSSGDGTLLLRGSSGNNKIYLSGESNINNYINSGNVGIGTTSPGSILEINGGSANGVKITAANSGTEFVLNASTSNGTSRLWVGGNGNVGIGTTSPTEKLEVAGTYGNTTLSGHAIGFTRAAANYLWAKTSGGSLSFTVNGNPIGSPSMVINSSGNVGIGTTAPSAKFHLLDTNNAVGGAYTSPFYVQLSRSSSGGSPSATYFTKDQYTLSGTDSYTNSLGKQLHAYISTSGTSTNFRNLMSRVHTTGAGAASTIAHYATHLEATGTGTIDQWYGMVLGQRSSITAFQNANATINHTYGLYLGTLTAGTQTNAPYAIYQEGTEKIYLRGNVGIGISNPNASLAIGNNTYNGNLAVATSANNNRVALIGNLEIVENSTGGTWSGQSIAIAGANRTMNFVAGGALNTADSSAFKFIAHANSSRTVDYTSFTLNGGYSTNTLAADYTFLKIDGNIFQGGINQSGSITGIDYNPNISQPTDSHTAMRLRSGDVMIEDGNLTVGGTVTAKEFHTEFVSASIIYQSGSTKFGDTSDDVHQFTGSLNVSGDLNTTGHVSLGLYEKLQWGDSGYNYLKFSGGYLTAGYTGDAFKFDMNSSGTKSIQMVADSNLQLLGYQNKNILITPSGSGNVGIGTTSPSASLHISASSSATAFRITQPYATDTNPDYVGEFTLANTTRGGLKVEGKGQTTNNNTPLLLYGNDTAGGAGARVVIKGNTDASNRNIMSIRNSNDTELLVVRGSGNVGIGNTSPSLKLDVTGTARTTSTTYLASNAGNVGIGTTSPSEKLHVEGNIKTTGALLLNGQQGLWLNQGGASVFSPAPGIFYSSSQGWYFQVPDNGQEKFSFKLGGLSAGREFRVVDPSWNPLFQVQGTGNVGIGTTSPSQKLEVVGSAIISGSIIQRSSSGILLYDSSGFGGGRIFGSYGMYNGEIAIQPGGTGAVSTFSKNGSLSIGGWTSFANDYVGSTLAPDHSLVVSGSVGIGTKAPLANLHVFTTGSVAEVLIQGKGDTVNQGSKLILSGSGTSTTRRATIELHGNHSSATDTAAISYHFDNTLKYQVGYRRASGRGYYISAGNGVNDSILYLNEADNNNVNITTDLIVQGSVTAQEFHTEFVSASIIYQSGSTKFGDTSDDVHSFTGSIKANSGNVVLSNNNELRWEDSTGTEKRILELVSSDLLELEGPNRIRLLPGGSTAIDLFSGHNTKYAMSSVHSFFDASANEAVRIVGDGKVGIGTTTPSEKLEVAGIIKTVHTDNAYTRLRGTGLYFSRSNSYLIAESDNSLNLNIGDPSSRWANTRINSAFIKFENGSTENMRITSTGNVGIGTTSPDTRLEVRTDSGGAASNSKLRVTAGAQGAYGGTAHFEGAYNDYGNVGHSNIVGKIEMASEVISPTDVGGTMKFFTKATGGTYATAPIERMRINSSGNVGIGTTSPTEKLDVNGTIKATAFVETSARKFKENIEPISSALESVAQLQGVSFNRIGEEKREYGFIADEVKDVAPELVSLDANGEVHGVHYARTVAVLTEAVKELNDKVKAQELFIKDLVSRIEKLENK